MAKALPLKPTFIEPMLASPVRELPGGAARSYEAKVDGYRCLVAKGSRDDVVLWSRRGNLFTARFPEIAHACQAMPTDTMIDGEVVAIDADGRMSFNALQHSRSKTPASVPRVRRAGSSGALKYQDQPLAGVRHWRLYRGQSVRCAYRRIR
jgi:ATP-dependent DNA ligase